MKPTHTKDFDIFVPSKEGAPRFVETIQVGVINTCGEEFLTPESSDKIEEVRAKHMGLMNGSAIKNMRNRLNLTQAQLTELLNCGDKSISRWENGVGYPTGVVNTVLRLLDEGFLAPASLRAVQGKRSERLIKSPQHLNAPSPLDVASKSNVHWKALESKALNQTSAA